MAELRITTIYDNYEHDARLRTGWGFSCLVEVCGNCILFDAGAERMVEMFNIEQLGIDLQGVDAVFISHSHGDHTGGFNGVMEAASGPKVYLGKSFPRNLKEEVRRFGGELVEADGLTEIFEDVCSTGELGGPIPEQSMVVKTGQGLVIITGCAHPGIVEIARAAQEQLDDQIHLLLGGSHLGGVSDAEVRGIISDLKGLGVRKIAPSHCTGQRAMELFAQAYGG